MDEQKTNLFLYFVMHKAYIYAFIICKVKRGSPPLFFSCQLMMQEKHHINTSEQFKTLAQRQTADHISNVGNRVLYFQKEA